MDVSGLRQCTIGSAGHSSDLARRKTFVEPVTSEFGEQQNGRRFDILNLLRRLTTFEIPDGFRHMVLFDGYAGFDGGKAV